MIQMNNEEAQLIKTAILDAVQTYMEVYKDKLNFVKTDVAIIKGNGTNRGNRIEIKGKSYDNVLSIGNVVFDRNNVVYVLIPNGQYSNMFILGKTDDSPNNIVGGYINIGNGAFKVDKNGNVTIRQGLINIGNGKFVVNPSGRTTATSLAINGGSINLNNKFIVDSSGNATVNNLTVNGGSFNIATQSGTQQPYMTSYTTQGIVYQSGISPQGGIESKVTKGNNWLQCYWGNTGGFQILSSSGGGNPMINFLVEPSVLEGGTESATFETSSSVSTHFYGTVYNAGGGAVFVSDKDKKHDINYLNNDEVAEFIYDLKPCEFKFNENTSDRLHHGLIAQDVKKSMKDKDWGLYIEQSNGEKGLRYDELISDLIATVQSQNERIKELERIVSQNTSVTPVKGSNSDLKEEVEQFTTKNLESQNEANLSDTDDIK
jgi:formylmethanofuran dehydrogenase subunit D